VIRINAGNGVKAMNSMTTPSKKGIGQKRRRLDLQPLLRIRSCDVLHDVRVNDESSDAREVKRIELLELGRRTAS
jgi:hypothetical protein